MGQMKRIRSTLRPFFKILFGKKYNYNRSKVSYAWNPLHQDRDSDVKNEFKPKRRIL